jgi:hypothetical protein
MTYLKKILLVVLTCASPLLSFTALGAGPTEIAALAVKSNPYCLDLMTVPDYAYLGTGWSFASSCGAAGVGLAAVNAIESTVKQDTSLLAQAEGVAQQILTVQNLVINTQELIRDIQENPLQVIVPNVDQIIKNQKRIDKLTKDIGDNSSTMGANLVKNLQTPNTIGLGQGSKFQLWSEARKRAIDESFGTVTSFVAELNDENKTISQAIKNLSSGHGLRANAKNLSQATGTQLTILGKIEQSLLNMLSLNAAEAGARLDSEASVNSVAIKREKGRNTKPSVQVEDKFDIVVSDSPSFFGLHSVK